MATLNINGKRVTVDDSFLQLSPEDQQRTVEEIAGQIGASQPAQPERSLGQTIYENVVGSGAVDTPGERLGQAIGETAKSFGAGVARGAAELAGLPGTLGNILDVGYEKLGIIPEGSAAQFQAPISGETIRGALGGVTGGATEYRGEGIPARIAGTVGEFMGGGAGGRVGLVGGGASELAGMATEGTALEPYARIGAGIAGSVLAGSPRAAFAGDDEASRMANLLESQGVRNITAGQARGSQQLMAAEGRLQPTAAQIDDYTASVMRQLGSNEALATPQNLRAVEQRLVQQMDDAVSGVNIVPNQSAGANAVRIGLDYVDRVPAGSLTPRVRGIANEINALSNANKAVPLSRLREWRSDIGRLTISPDAATREAAHGLRSIIDDMTDEALRAANRADDIAKLGQARSSYRDYIAVRDAASRVGAEGGTLSPQALNQSVVRSQGRENYATGRTTDMADFTRAGASVLRPAPTVSAGGQRTLRETLPALGAVMTGAGALQAGVDPAVAAMIAGVGAMAPAAGQAAMRSTPVQMMLRDPYMAIARPVSTVPGLLSQQ